MRHSVVFIPLIVLVIVLIFIFVKRNKFLNKIMFDLALGGIIFSALVAIYSLILAFVVIIVWQQYQSAGDRIETETSSLFNVYRSTFAFKDDSNVVAAKLVRSRIDSYYISVINNEWPLLESGALDEQYYLNNNSNPDSVTRNINRRIWHAVFQLNPVNEGEKVWYNATIKNMYQFAEARHFRLANKDYHIPKVMWWMLVAGAVLVVIFSMFLESKNDWYHGFKVLTISVMIIFSLLLVNMLNHPFNGILRLSPEPFNKSKIVLGNW